MTISEELADLIHDALCGDADGINCKRYDKEKGTPHYHYYHKRAENIYKRLQPAIGSANVIMVVRIILDEVV